MTGSRVIRGIREWLLLVLAILLAGAVLIAAMRQYYRAAYPTNYSELVLAASEVNDLPPALVYAVIRTESGFNPDAQSHVPAHGLMQITKDTFEWAQMRTGEKEQLRFDDLFGSELNIRYGTAILRLLLEEFGSEQNALCAYHAGWGRTKQWLDDPACAPDGKTVVNIPSSVTRQYVQKVLQTKEIYETLYDLT